MIRTLTLILILAISVSTGISQYDSFTESLDSTITETQLGKPKHIKVFTPDGFDKTHSQQYTVYVIFDMQNSINFDLIIRNIDYLSSFGQIPVGVILGIESLPMEGRYYETQLKENDADALGEENAEFVFETIIPFLQNEYNASSGTVLIGHSRYGYFTTHLLSEYPEDLIGVISLCPFFEQKNTNHSIRLVERIQATNLKHDLFYVAAVGDTFVDTGDYYEMMASLDKADLPDNFHYKGLLYPLGDHYTVPGMSIGTALYSIFEKWYEIQQDYYRSQTDDLKSLHSELQNKVAAIYGAPLPFSLGVYNGVGWRYYGEENKASARASWELLAEAYPQFSYAWLFAAEVAFEQGDMSEYNEMLKSAEASVRGNTILTEEEIEEVKEEIVRISGLKK